MDDDNSKCLILKLDCGRPQIYVCVEKICENINVNNVGIVHEPLVGTKVSCKPNIFLFVVFMDNDDMNP